MRKLIKKILRESVSSTLKRRILNLDIDKSVNKEKLVSFLKVIPNKYVYHTSNPVFRDKISKEGLIPKGKSETWLSDTNIDGKVIFVVNSNKEDYRFDSTYDDDIYRIDTTKLNNKWYYDPNFDDGLHLITIEKIPLNDIKLIYKGSLH